METRNTPGLLYWHRIVILFCLGWVGIWAYRSAMPPLYGEIQADLGVVSDASMGLIASLYFLPYSVLQIPAGMLMDRFGVKAVLVPGFGFFALATLFIGLGTSLEMVHAGSFCAGVGSSAFYSGAFSISGKVIPLHRRTFANAIINCGAAVGMTMGLVGASWLVKSLGMSWSVPIYASAGIILLITACFAVGIRPGGETRAEAKPCAPVPEQTAEFSETTLFSLWSLGSYLLIFVNCYAYYMLVAWLPHFLETERGFQGVAIGMSASLVGIAAIPGALFFSRLADSFRAKRLSLLVLLQIGSILALLLVVAAPVQGVLLLGLIFYGLTGKLASDSLMVSHVVERAPRNRLGTYLATFNCFATSASVAAPWVTGLISDRFHSKAGGFYLCVCLLTVGTVFFFIVNQCQARRENEAGVKYT